MEFAQQNLGNCLIRQNWLGLVDSAHVVTTFFLSLISIIIFVCFESYDSIRLEPGVPFW